MQSKDERSQTNILPTSLIESQKLDAKKQLHSPGFNTQGSNLSHKL